MTLVFSAVTNFAEIAHLPEQEIPQKPTDLRIGAFRPGGPPTDCILVGPRGSRYDMGLGVVQSYGSWTNYFIEQNPARRGQYAGASLLTSDQAVQLASNVLRRLIRNGAPLGNGPPKLLRAGDYKGQPIPFFKIQWPAITPGGLSTGAVVDIDGRTARIVQINLYDIAFSDPDGGARMTSRVYTPDPVSAPKRIDGPMAPRPTTNEVSRAIAKWLIFCARLGLDTGSKTNLADVDWERTSVLPWPGVVPDGLPSCSVYFTNGACFQSFEGTVFAHVLSSYESIDPLTLTPTRGINPFRGKILKRWEDLAQGIKPLLSAKLGIPQAILDALRGSPSYRPPEVGTEGRRELWVDWRLWPDKATRPDGLIALDETREAFEVQFDLETGHMEGITFVDPHLLEILQKVESKW